MSKFFEALFVLIFVVIDALLLTYFRSFFSIVFHLFRNISGKILNSQADHPTLQNVDFTVRILTCLENQRFRSKDGFESVLGLSRAPFGSSWGALGGLLGALWGL